MTIQKTKEVKPKGSEVYDRLVNRMEALCAPMLYTKRRCEQLIDDYLAEQQKKTGAQFMYSEEGFEAVAAILTDMEQKAANPNKGVTKKLVTASHGGYKPGDLVLLLMPEGTQCGIVTSLVDDDHVLVQIGESTIGPVPFAQLKSTTAAEYKARIEEIAKNFGDSMAAMVPVFLGPIHWQRDPMSYAVLYELEQKIWEVAKKNEEEEGAAKDAVEKLLTVETGHTPDADEDIFGAFFEAEDGPGACSKCLQPITNDHVQMGHRCDNLNEVAEPEDSKSIDAAPTQTSTTSAETASTDIATDPVAVETPEDLRPVYNDAGNRVNPETGEIELHGMLLALKWSEYPQLSANPTRVEVENIREKVDQVLDIILTCRETAARYRNQAEARAKEKEDRADAYENFLVPLSKALGKVALPRIQSGKNKGKLKQKTLHLASGDLKFRVEGGWSIFHYGDLVKELVKKIEAGKVKKEDVFARQEWHIDSKKLLKKVAETENKEQLPGIMFKPINELGSVVVSKAKPAGDNGDDDIEEV